MIQLMKKAKIHVKAIKLEGKGRTTYSRGFLSLRHTVVSALANAGFAHDIRKKLAGHADPKIHATYAHHEVDVLRDAVAKLPRLFEQTAG